MNTQKRKNVPDKPRKLRAIKKAREFILRCDIKWLPVDPFVLFDKFEWLLLTWEEAKEYLGTPDPLNLKKCGAEAKTLSPRGSNEIITVYNSEIFPFSRVRWTIAHEIGHIVLGHLSDFECTSINRGGLQKNEYKVLEDEANFFASELLQPLPILRSLGICNPNDIIEICNVSRIAANNRNKDIEWWKNKLEYHEGEEVIQKQFEKYLQSATVCTNTNKEILIQYDRKGCLEENMFNEKMLYVKSDSNKRFLQCPQCGNTSLSDKASYCKICGLHLYNTCTNDNENFANGECGANNDGDARYCEQCGEPTVLTKLGLLIGWEELLESHKEVSAGVDPELHIEKQEKNTNPPWLDEEPIPF